MKKVSLVQHFGMNPFHLIHQKKQFIKKEKVLQQIGEMTQYLLIQKNMGYGLEVPQIHKL